MLPGAARDRALAFMSDSLDGVLLASLQITAEDFEPEEVRIRSRITRDQPEKGLNLIPVLASKLQRQDKTNQETSRQRVGRSKQYSVKMRRTTICTTQH